MYKLRVKGVFYKNNYKKNKIYKNKNKNKKIIISRELNPFKIKKLKFKKNIKNIEYYNYYKFDYFFIIYMILKANNLNRVLIKLIRNIDVYAIELSGKGKSSLKIF